MDEACIRDLVITSIELKRRFFEDQAGRLLTTGRAIAERMRAGGRLLAFGNGGSAADAQHLVGELVVRFLRDRAALSAIALTTDPSVMTAMANDVGFEQVFRRQVEAHGRRGDVAIAISTSGRSPNVIQGARAARERGLYTVALSGNGGGPLADLVDVLFDVPHTDTPRIQEVHGMIVHILCEIIEEEACR